MRKTKAGNGGTRRMVRRNEGFRCEQCNRRVEPIRYGGSNRNHCPYCLFSKHVDAEIPGDRAESCRGLMRPVSVFVRRTGEYVLVHKCEQCGARKYNRSASDDDFEKIVEFSTHPVQT